jgi:hypothetical protein
MRHRLFILLLALSCLGARFHCALGHMAMVEHCGEGHAHHDHGGHHSHGAPGDCNGCCPDLESDSTSMARKLADTSCTPLLVNPWATQLLAGYTQAGGVVPDPMPEEAPPPDDPGTALTEALASHSISLRGPPSRA